MKIKCSVIGPNSIPILIDHNLGPIGKNYTSSMVHAWNYSVGTVNITYIFITHVIRHITHMHLYFYSITAMGIGLPSVTVYRSSTAMEHYITGNDDITQDDSMRRNVLLSLASPSDLSGSYTYTLQFDFENTDVEWLVLSEIEVYN